MIFTVGNPVAVDVGPETQAVTGKPLAAPVVALATVKDVLAFIAVIENVPLYPPPPLIFAIVIGSPTNKFEVFAVL